MVPNLVVYSTLAHRVKKWRVPFRADSDEGLVTACLLQPKSVPIQNLADLG
jgi:hypothetical protein